MNIAVIFHDNDMYSGASRSMLSLMETWKKDNNKIIAIIPSNGTMTKVIREKHPSAEGVRNGELQVAGEIPGPSWKDHPPTTLTGSLASGMQTEQNVMGPGPQGSPYP